MIPPTPAGPAAHGSGHTGEIDRAVDVKRLITTVRGWWPLLIGSAILAFGAGYFFSSVAPKVYEARTVLIVGQSLSTINPDYTQLLASQRLSTTYANVATTRPLLEGVIEQLDLEDTPDTLLQRIEVDAPLDSTLLTILVEDADPRRAAEVANALGQQLIESSPALQGGGAGEELSIEEEIKGTRDQMRAIEADVAELRAVENPTAEEIASLDALDQRLASLRSTYVELLSFSSSSASNLLSVIQPAVETTTPISPRPLLNAILAGLVGLMIAGGVIILSQHIDDTVKSADDVEQLLGLPTLGTIKRMPSERGRREQYRLAALLYPRSEVSDAYRSIRTNIEFASVDRPLRTMVVTSSLAGEGKTVTAANLAIVFAQTGRRVLLVDADLRRPSVHRIFAALNTGGLTTLVLNDRVPPFTVIQSTEQENLHLLTSGPLPPNPAELTASNRMRVLLRQLADTYDLVVVDSAPLVVPDSAVLSSYLDGTILVIDARKTGRGTVRHAREALAKGSGLVLGVVLNKLSGRNVPTYGAYYGPDQAESARQPEPIAQRSGPIEAYKESSTVG